MVQRTAVERRPAGGQRVQHAPGRVQVTGQADRGALDLLRRHVRGRAHHHAGRRQPRVIGGLGQHRGDPEVQHPGQAVRTDHHVRGLEIPVHHAGAVRDGQRPADVLPPARHLGQRREHPVLREDLVQRTPVQPLHHQVQHRVRLPVEPGLAHVVHRDDERARQAREQLGLALEPLSDPRIAPGGDGAHELDGHLPFETQIQRLPHGAAAARPQLPPQPVPAVENPVLHHSHPLRTHRGTDTLSGPHGHGRAREGSRPGRAGTAARSALRARCQWCWLGWPHIRTDRS